MKERTIYEEIREWFVKTSEFKCSDEHTKKDWMFGALDMALALQLITPDQFDELNKEFEIFSF